MPQEIPLLLFVINPISGGKTKENWESAINNHFKEKPYRIEFFILNGKDDKGSLDHYIETLSPNTIVAVGGDGTVKMIAELIADKDIMLGILPAGSANGMAKELGISNDLTTALEVITDGQRKDIDVIKINDDHICLHLSDSGWNARLIKYYEQHPKRGMMSYARFVFKALWRKTRLRARIQTDEGEVFREAFMIVLANASMYGTGAVINPRGDVSDGYFEIVVLRQISIIELAKMLLKLNTFNPEKTEIFRTKNVTIEIAKATHFQIDGEYMGKTKKVIAEILPSYMRVIVPKPQPVKA